MYMLILTVLIVGVTAYIWSARGFYSAFIHMICVIAAGAIAFGVWEPLGYLILGQSGDRGMGAVLGGMAWGLALALPFAVALAVLRAAVDKLLPANAQCDTISDYIGGGVCGLISGVLSAGIMVLSLGYLRTNADFGGYRPVVFTGGSARGSLQKSPDNMVPWVDKITARVYSALSLTTLRTAEPLAKWRPDLESEGPTLRTTYNGSSRNTLKEDAFKFLGWYTVGDMTRGNRMDDLTADSWIPNPQKFTDLEGEAMAGPGYLAGFILQFNSHAREKTGQVVVGNGQVRLVVQSDSDDDDCKPIHPIAVVTNVDDPTKIEYARFRFNSDEAYFSSVGAVSEATMAFEFPVPFGYRPLALYVKGLRVDLSEKPATANYIDPPSRDAKIQAGELSTGMGGVGPILDAQGNPVQAQQTQAFEGDTFTITNTIGKTIQTGTAEGLTVAEEGRGWTIRSGETTLRNDQLKGFGAGLDPKLQINRFSITDDTVVVQVDISPTHRSAESFQRIDSADKTGNVVLIDTNGRTYEAVGFVFQDSRMFHLRYTKGSPIKLKDADSVSLSTPDRTLKLIFVVSLGVEISEFRIGSTTIEEYNPPKKCDAKQR